MQWALSSRVSAMSAVVVSAYFPPEIFSWEGLAASSSLPCRHEQLGWGEGRRTQLFTVGWTGVEYKESLSPEPFLRHVTKSSLCLVTKGWDTLKVVALWAHGDIRPEWNKYIFQFREFSPPRRLLLSLFKRLLDLQWSCPPSNPSSSSALSLQPPQNPVLGISAPD